MTARHRRRIRARAAKVTSIAIDPQDANVGYVVMDSPGNHGIWRSQNIQAVSPDWEDITKDFHRSTVFPEGVGASADRRRARRQRRRRRGADAAAARQRARTPSLAGNWPVL